MTELRAERSSGVRDDAAFDELYARRWLAMVRFASLTTGSQAIAEEVVQDAFVQLFRNWPTVHNPEAWLRVAVVSNCRGWVRRQTVERRHRVRPPDTELPNESVIMRDALQHLSDRQRAAIVLRFYEDLPEAEIASVLGCRPGTVKSLLARATRRLRQEMNQ
ncbi:MAG TPA: sigma-70 family RNA polymerase sigma factor [Ilumatobacteraceae bacterium]|nr:sigma-70 family RNA polymerase sigma factor [Ilumatobacteraceae bacterium]HRB02251.1 sigma-70 family RNA polymerase sigma factor [Ilumatobacteraceae bacterium]